MNNLLTETEGTNWAFYVIIGVMLVLVIGFMIWQSITGKKKQQQALEMVDKMKIGDKVKTIGGVCGYVAEINNAENTFVLKTGMEGKESYVKFDKGAIYQTAPVEDEKAEKKEVKAEEKSAETTEIKE